MMPFDVLKIRGEHQSRRPSRRLTFMFNVGDDHNVPFTVPQLISDPTQGRRGPLANTGGAAKALRCHGGCGVFSQAERGDDKGRELEP